MTDCNADLIAQARANVADRNNPAHRTAITRGDWDQWGLVQAEIARLLRTPVLAEGDDQ